MRQNLLLLTYFLVLSTMMMANPVNKEEARQKALQFMAGKVAASRGTTLSSPDVQLAAAEDYYYVFNIGQNNGFIIISGDDRTPEILGYSDNGSFDVDNVPTNMRAFLQGYADEINALPETAAGSRGVGQKRAVVRNSISPLLTTQWNQYAPYNNNCPVISGSHAVTGCVATAMAQVMNFHRCPAADVYTETIPGYSSVGSLSPTKFNWDSMKDSYMSNEDGDEVAKLMYYCGVSVQMSYGVDGSEASTSNAVNALIDYFDYDAGAKYASRSSYGYGDWVSLLYNELDNQRPVLMGGQSTGGGHAFVCDGYDEEDFFHINWGWGGMSDGYYRLANLNPKTQGAGSSTTNDGYNLDLGACIGVQPNKGTPPAAELLTVRDLQFHGSSGMTMNFSRTDLSSDFYNPILECSFWNFTGSTHVYDYGLRLKKDGAVVQDFKWTEDQGASIDNNHALIPACSFWFGAGLEDGIYQIVGICKFVGATEWIECNDADKYYIEAVIEGMNLTMNVIRPADYSLSVTNITGAETLRVGQSQDMTVSITNNGTGDYHGDITLAFTWEEDERTYIFKLGGKTVDIEAGQSKDIVIVVTPSRMGSYTLRVYNGLFHYGTLLYTKTEAVEVTEGSSTANLSFSNLIIDNNDGSYVYGNTLKGSITVSNIDTTNPYKQGLTVTLYKTINWVDNGGGSWSYNYTSVGSKNVNDAIPAGSDFVLNYDFRGLDYGERYFLGYSYYTYSGSSGTAHSSRSELLTISHGFVSIDADGNVTASAPTPSVTVPDEAVAVDLRGQSTVENVNTSYANPNRVYLLDEDADVPTGVDGNVVKGDAATSISLIDGYDFNTPLTFTAGTVSYSRIIEQGTNSTNGHWTTLILPFDVDKVTVEGVEKDWFHSADDTGKHFWVKKFVNDGTGTVSFDYTDKIEANTPYIIAVPDNTWGDKWQLSGKTLVFTGTNKTVSSEKAIASGDHYKFVGTTTNTSPTEIFALNAGGTSFEYSEIATLVAPFRAYFKAASVSTASSSLRITSPEGQATAIGQLPAEISLPKAIYTLDGRRVMGDNLKKGVYIVGGQKVIK